MKNMKKLLIFSCLAGIVLAAGIGSSWTAPAIPAWYAGLDKPGFNPPNWLFAPVWTILYLLMALAAFLAIRKTEKPIWPSSVFLVQIFFNGLWSFIFFKLNLPGWAFAEIILLWLLIVLNIIVFYRIHKVAGLLLVPYLLWVSFAGVLNYYIWILNT